uniref:Uncharacterized protein n=1 Tax=Larimichthys crocea TaxID=215358 RepID=A0A0F8CE76_LARCR
MDKARNSKRYQKTSEPMQLSASQKSMENGLDQGWTEMMSELNKISSNTVKKTKQSRKKWNKDKKPFYKARFPFDGRKNNNKRWEKKNHRQVAHVAPAARVAKNKNTTELQREKDQNQLLQKELERVSGLNKELNERYQSDVVNKRQQTNTSLENEIQQKFSAELQREKDKCKALQEQLEKTSVSLQEVNTRYETDIKYVRQQAYNLQLHLDKEMKQKKALQADYDKLQAAYTLNQQKFSAECDTEKIKIVQHELETIHVSHCQLRQLYDTDVVAVRQKAETLQRELDRETKAHADTVSEGWRVINTLRAEQDALRQKMAEVNNIQQNAFKRERTFERELEGLKAQLKEQISVNLKLTTELQAEKEDYGTPRKRCRREEKDECEPMKKQATINSGSSLGRIKDVEMSETNLPETTRTPSLWKSPHHFLGLK